MLTLRGSMRLTLAAVVLVLASTPLAAQDRAKVTAALDRFNKQADERLARMRRVHIESECKAEAAKAYSAIRFNKRREFVDDCVRNATAAAAMPASHQAQ
jgi:hypothetical protein